MFVAGAALLTACSGGPSTAPSAAASCVKADASGVVKVSAENLQFSTSCIEVPAEAAFKVEFTNKEAIPHDIAVYSDPSKKTELFRGDVVDQQGKTVTYNVPALKAGEHYFVCTIHANMSGTVVAR